MREKFAAKQFEITLFDKTINQELNIVGDMIKINGFKIHITIGESKYSYSRREYKINSIKECHY